MYFFELKLQNFFYGLFVFKVLILV